MGNVQLGRVRGLRGDLLAELRREASEEIPLPSPPAAELDWSTVAEMLDFLSKELVRRQSEQSVALFISRAAERRSSREEDETRRRLTTTELSFPLPELDGFLADLLRQSSVDTAPERARDDVSVSELVHQFLFPLLQRLLRR